LLIGGDIVDTVANMPVDTLACSGAFLPATHLQDERGPYRRVGFVIVKMDDAFDDIIFVRRRCVALLARFTGRAQVVDRAFNRTIIGVGHNSVHLFDAVNF